MAKLLLEPELALGGYNKHFGNILLKELQGVALFSIALPVNPAQTQQTIETQLGAAWPAPGLVTTSGDGNCQLLGLQSEQAFAMIRSASDKNDVITAPEIEGAYITDQSDSWTGLIVSGAGAVSALERICPLDLHTDSFGPDQVARTVMEHLAVIIVCVSTDEHLMLSPRSSSKSFLQAMEVSLYNTVT